MTTIFCYRIKNAWILVSDRLETNQTQSQRTNSGDETHPYDVITKIKKTKRYVYGLAGISVDIQKITDLLDSSIESEFDFNRFCTGINALYGNEILELDVELLLIDSESVKAYKIAIKSLPNSLSEAEIFSIENGYIGSGATKSRARYQTTSILEAISNREIGDQNDEGLSQILEKAITALEIMEMGQVKYSELGE